MVNPDPVVTSVQIKGARQLRPEVIRPQLGQRATHPLHWVPLLNFVYPRYHLDDAARQQDRTRIANFYALNGFFDARVVDSGTQILRERKDGSASSVRVVHVVEEGEESFLRKVTLKLGHPPGAASRMSYVEMTAIEAVLTRALPLVAERRFSMRQVEESEELLRSLLAEQAYAFASVTTDIDAYPEEQAVDVHFTVVPGNRSVFGPVTISGLSDVAERYVARHVRFEAGDPFDGKKVEETQQAIYKMGTFSLVTVAPEIGEQPEVDDEGHSIVPVDIILRERKARTFRGGGGVGWSRGSFDVHGAVSLGHINLFKRLVRMELDFEGGLVYLGPEDIGPGGHLELDLRWPDFPVRTLTLYGTGGVETDVRPGYKYVSPEGDVGLVWSPWKHLKLSVSYNISYFALYDNRLADLGTVRVDDIAFDDGYFLSLLRQELVLDLRDNLLAPNRGMLLSMTVDEAGGGLGGRYRYVKLTGDLRGYVPIVRRRLVLGLRAWGSFIHTWGDLDQVPIQEAVFAGGDGSVRGWKTDYLGPRLVEPDCSRSDCILPLGGKLGAVGSVEIRGRPIGGLWLAGFCDFGRVWSSVEDLDSLGSFFEGLQPSFGGGVRYDMSVGRIRFDVAVHPRSLTDPVFREAAYVPPCLKPNGCENQVYGELPEWNFHIGFGESF